MFQQLGSNCTTVSQVIESEDKAVFKAIQDGIDRYNTYHLISNAQKVLHVQTGYICAYVFCVIIIIGTEMDIVGYRFYHPWRRIRYMIMYILNVDYCVIHIRSYIEAKETSGAEEIC